MRASTSHGAAIRARVSTVNPTPYSWINEAAQTSKASGNGRLAGRAIAIKDNISYRLAPTSCSSQILDGEYKRRKNMAHQSGYHPLYDATCVSSLLVQGAEIVGQAKMDEFGMGSVSPSNL
jgi:aspartyl-tRNA(Asn)/glutamyl-tRNA(Gln) amidotransferase subunit A